MWQFAEAVRGLADGCRDARHPGHRRQRQLLQPDRRRRRSCRRRSIGVLGVIDDVSTPVRRTGSRTDGALIYLLGETRDEFGGSEWAHVVHGHLGGRPPRVDLRRRAGAGRRLIDAARDGLIDSAHDLSDGGLAQALVECCLAARRRRAHRAARGLDPFVALFSESAGRAVVTVPRAARRPASPSCARARGLPHSRIGRIVDVLEIETFGRCTGAVHAFRLFECAAIGLAQGDPSRQRVESAITLAVRSRPGLDRCRSV